MNPVLVKEWMRTEVVTVNPELRPEAYDLAMAYDKWRMARTLPP